MRLSSIVSVLVVTASFALGGCAADAEPTSTGTDQPNVALSDPNAPAIAKDRTGDVAQTGTVSDQYANPSDEVRARQVESYNGGVADPRIDIVPSGFNAVPSQKIAATPPVFHEVNQLLIGARTEPGLTPYSHDKP
jgi:hypothetical protein